MAEFFVWSVSKPAPLVGDEDVIYVEADTPAGALEDFRRGYKHPAGLYFVRLYRSADAFYKHPREPIASWKAPSDLVERIAEFRADVDRTATVDGVVAWFQSALNLLRDAEGEIRRLQS